MNILATVAMLLAGAVLFAAPAQAADLRVCEQLHAPGTAALSLSGHSVTICPMTNKIGAMVQLDDRDVR